MQPGDFIRGKYRIVREIGAGGYATVFLGRQDDIGRDVAIKVLPKSDDRRYETAIARFRREAKLIASLQDTHTVSLFDFGQMENGDAFMVFELLPGDDLEKYLETHGPLDEISSIEVAKQVLSSLREAHHAGIVHRDLKPSNIMLAPTPDAPWFVKLIDFGIARPTEGPEGEALTRTGFAVGTPRFMAPEQLYGAEVTPATDLYALGLVWVELLLGHRGMDRPAIGEGELPQLPCSPWLQTIIHKLLQPEPQDRFRRTDDVLRELNGIRANTTLVEARPARLDDQPATPPSIVLGIVGVALAVVVFGGALVAFLLHEDEPEPTTPAATVRVNPAFLKTAPAAQKEVAAVLDLGVEDPCGDPGTTEHVDELGARPRSWVLHVPESDHAAPRPLLLFFHGAGYHPRDYVDRALAAYANKKGYIIAAPVGEDTFGWSHVNGSLTWVSDLVEVVSERTCVDRSRIIVLGDDTGGAVTMGLACTPNIKAVVTTSFLPLNVKDAGCEPEGIPHLLVVPDRSRHIPLDGKDRCPAGTPHATLDQQLTWWKQLNHCKDRSESTSADHVRCDVWDCESPFESCVVSGGQQWPSMPPRVFDIFGCDGGAYKLPPLDLVAPFFDRFIGEPATD